MRFKLGYTTITCTKCGAITSIDNKDVDVLSHHACPSCGQVMTDRELGALKMHYYLMQELMFREINAADVKFFKYDITLNPHYEE